MAFSSKEMRQRKETHWKGNSNKFHLFGFLFIGFCSDDKILYIQRIKWMHVLDNIVNLHAIFIHLLLNRHRTNTE